MHQWLLWSVKALTVGFVVCHAGLWLAGCPSFYVEGFSLSLLCSQAYNHM
jgi:hypothetical protein